MTRMTKYSAACIGLSALAFAIGARAQTVAPGPYYAPPAWDQTLPCTTPSACPRFIVLSNFASAAVLDRETGLVWERSPGVATFPEHFAHVECVGKNVGNRLGWRMPTIQELSSLIDPTVPGLPPGHPFTDVQPASYWSATSNSVFANSAWGLDFVTNAPVFLSKGALGAETHVWCVRGGQGTEGQ